MARTAHLRLAAVDGKRVRGVKRARPVVGRVPPPSMVKMAERLAAQVRLSETLVKLLFNSIEPGGEARTDPLIIQAIARSALVEMNGLGNLADYFADILPDPTRW